MNPHPPRIPQPAGAKSFIGVQAPHLVVNKPTIVPGGLGGAPTFTTNVGRVLMQGFAGLQVSPACGTCGGLLLEWHGAG